MLIPEFQGGLGNMMFQLASTYSIAKQTGHDFGVLGIPMPPTKHSSIDYKKNIFSKWVKYRTKLRPTSRFFEVNSKFIDLELVKKIPNTTISTMYGYFQHEKYLRPFKKEVIDLFDLSIDPSVLEKYKDIDNAFFLHVRRGDYVGNSFHELDLKSYYERAVKLIGKGIAYIVSNDVDWCKQWDFLKTIPHCFVEENDADTLIIMSKCGLGGIGANSSFSWWGLYLNTNRPHLIIPEKWFPHEQLQQDGFKFEEVTVLNLTQ